MSALENIGERQALWSATADALKSTLDHTRWMIFGLSITGATLAAVASQNVDGTRWWLAMAATVALATATFLTSRLMGARHLSDWTRARIASEGLKREAYIFAAQAAPYEDAATRDDLFRAACDKIEEAANDLEAKMVKARGDNRLPKAPIKPDEYIAARITDQCANFYDRKAEHYRRLAKNLGWTEFGLALSATIMTAVVGAADKASLPMHFDFVALAAVLTTVGGVITTHIEASRYDFLVTTYRATTRRLKSLQNSVSPGHPFVVPSLEWSTFVSRCEAILSEANGAWLAKWTKGSSGSA